MDGGLTSVLPPGIFELANAFVTTSTTLRATDRDVELCPVDPVPGRPARSRRPGQSRTALEGLLDPANKTSG